MTEELKYATLCPICLQPTGPDKGPEDAQQRLRTFSFGTGPDNCLFAVMTFLCPEHRDADVMDVRRTFYRLITQLREHDDSDIEMRPRQ